MQAQQQQVRRRACSRYPSWCELWRSSAQQQRRKQQQCLQAWKVAQVTALRQMTLVLLMMMVLEAAGRQAAGLALGVRGPALQQLLLRVLLLRVLLLLLLRA
jgi:hypothetical protein